MQKATSDEEVAKRRNTRLPGLTRQQNKASTHLVDHVSKQALDFIRVDLLLAAHANGGGEFGDRDPRPSGGRVYVWSHSARNEDLSQQISETSVMGSFKGKVDPALDKFVLALLQCLVESVQVAPLYALGQGQEQLLQPGVGVQEGVGRESLGGE